MAETSDVKTIPITSEMIVDKRRPMKLGTSMLSLPEGKALCTDAVSLTIITAVTPDTGEKFIIVIAVAEHNGAHLGSLSPMTPTEARNFAASLIDGANEIDGGANG